MNLQVSLKIREHDVSKSMCAPLDGDIWDYLRLLSTKLEEDSMPNLYRENIRLLGTTYDFEKAVGRTLNLTNGKLEWNCNMLDRIGGKGTSASIIFELKKNGKFHGLKRRTNPLNPVPKMRKFGFDLSVERCNTSPNLKLVKDSTTGMFMSIVDEMKNVSQASCVNVKTKAVKVGRNKNSSSLKNSSTQCNKMTYIKSGRKEHSCQSCDKNQTTCIKSGRPLNLENGCVQYETACTCTGSECLITDCARSGTDAERTGDQEMYSETFSAGTSKAKMTIGSSASNLKEIAKGQVGESLKTQARNGKQLKIGGFLVNKEFNTKGHAELKDDYQTPLKMNPRRSKCGGSSNSPLAGQGSIQKYLKGRRSSPAVGCILPLDGSVGVRKAMRGLDEKANTECVDGRLDDQTKQLIGTSLTLEADEAASQD